MGIYLRLFNNPIQTKLPVDISLYFLMSILVSLQVHIHHKILFDISHLTSECFLLEIPSQNGSFPAKQKTWGMNQFVPNKIRLWMLDLAIDAMLGQSQQGLHDNSVDRESCIGQRAG